jgi:cytochrome c biogenesis protein CcmG/thiol:disulfide interchange protein DsbE
MNKKLWYSIPFILLAAVAILFAVHVEKTTDKNVELLGKIAPEFSGYSYTSSRQISSKEYANRFVVLKFFGTWCKYCQIEKSIIKQLSMVPNVNIIGISVKDSQESLLEWSRSMPGAYKEILLDSNNIIAKHFMVSAVPETFVINTRGLVVYHHKGALNNDIIRSKIMPIFSQNQSIATRLIVGDNEREK